MRSAKRTAEAAVRIAGDLWGEGRVEPGRALAGVTADHVRQILRPAFVPEAVTRARADGALVATGIGACPGQVSGELAFTSDDAQSRAAAGRDVILARPVTSPADLHGMIAARGIVTSVGGSTSHAAVVARALGTSCVVGCAAAQIDDEAATLSAGDVLLRAGDPVSLDGSTGELFRGIIPVEAGVGQVDDLADLVARCRDASACEVWGRVTLPQQVDRVRRAGGTGVVLAIDDALAASGNLDHLLAQLLQTEDLSARHFDAIRNVVEEHMTPVLAAAEQLPVAVRVLDFLADDAREYLQQTPLLTAHPELALPLGIPALIEAQCLGVAAAATAAGRSASTIISVRHVSAIGEARSLETLESSVRERYPKTTPRLGVYVTSAAGLARADALRQHVPIQWVELKTIQAIHHGLPPRMLLTREPLDRYLDAGMFGLDPRYELDPTVADQLSAVPESGIRLAMPATDELIADVYRLGFRRYAVETDEVAPTLLCLAKAATHS